MSDFKAASNRFQRYAEDLREMAREMSGDLDAESEELHLMRKQLLAHCASMADEVEATAQTWGGREAAAEIGRRIRELMEAGK